MALLRSLETTLERATARCGTAALLAFSVAQGCAVEEPASEVGSTKLALTVAQPSEGNIDVVATRNGYTVSIELRRGEARPLEWKGDLTEDGAFEGDVMVADGKGRIMLAEMGGHGPIDGDWGRRLHEVQGAVDTETRRHELMIAEEAADALITHAQLDHESRLLARGLGDSIRATLDGLDDGTQVLATAVPSGPETDQHANLPIENDGDVAVTRQAAAPTYVHQIYIRRALCCWNGYEHSATRLRIFNNVGTLLADVKTRNHGRWVDDASMSNAASCPVSFSNRTNQTPFYIPYSSTDTFLNGQAGGCPTSYGPLGSQHVCSDDSYAEYLNVKNNPFVLPSYATCSDNTLRQFSPTCF